MKIERLQLRISGTDKQIIETRAKELELSVSEYLRRLAIIDIEKSKDQCYSNVTSLVARKDYSPALGCLYNK